MTRRIAVDLTPLLPSGDNGGAKVFVMALLRHLARLLADHEFVLLTQAASHEELATLDARNMRRELVMAAGAAGRRSTLATAWEGFASHAPDALAQAASRVVHAVYRRGQRGGARAALDAIAADVLFCPFTAPTFHRPGTPTVCTVYDLQHRAHPEFFTPTERAFREATLRDVAAKASAIACISRFACGELIATGLVPAERVRVIALRLAARLASTGHGFETLDRLGLRPGGYLLYPANAWPHKNHTALLQAFAAARASGLDPAMRLALPGAQPERLAGEIAALQLERIVVCPGFIEDAELAALLRHARGLVFPSLYEGFGLPVLEAMAAEVPVACSAATALREVAGDAALLFDPGRVDDIASAILRLATDEALRARLVELGSVRAAEYEDTDLMAREYASVLSGAAAR